MPFVLVFIGAVLIVAAFRNTQGDLATALETDVPGFLKWAVAIAAIGGLTYVPGLRTTARWMLGLVLLVIVLTNAKQAFGNLGNLSGAAPTPSTPAATPTSAYLANPSSPNITTAEVTGTGNVNAAGQQTSVTSSFGGFDPAAYLAAFEGGGFGGVV